MNKAILFTGHMIDAPDRASSRFPPDKESTVRNEIRKQLLQEKSSTQNELQGIAGGACGGDILFHEACLELHIPSELYLALPIDAFRKASVSFAGKSWEKRFDKLIFQLPVHILPASKHANNAEAIWGQANQWMLHAAQEKGNQNVILLALWDGKEGDGSGGTEHLVKEASEQGAEIRIIDINSL